MKGDRMAQIGQRWGWIITTAVVVLTGITQVVWFASKLDSHLLSPSAHLTVEEKAYISALTARGLESLDKINDLEERVGRIEKKLETASAVDKETGTSMGLVQAVPYKTER
jgi:hypothetical protein